MSTGDKNALDAGAGFDAPVGATPPRTVRCHVALLREDDGDFSAIVLNLPGVGSCGDSSDEAIENVRDAVKTAVNSYEQLGMPIPWRATTAADVPKGASATWINVHV